MNSSAATSLSKQIPSAGAADRPPVGATSSTAYPRRPPFFAHRFVRLLFRTCAAAEIGPDAALLLVAVAHTEDAKRYTGPVRFFAENLADQCGFSVSSMSRARAKAVTSGWLHYEPGAKRRMATYWVMIPDRFADIPDGPNDHSGEEMLGQVDDVSGEERQSSVNLTEQVESIRSATDNVSGAHLTDLLPSSSSFPQVCATATPSAPALAEPAKKKNPRRKPAAPRPRNPLFDAVAEVCGMDPVTAGGLIGSVAAALSRAHPPYTPEDVREFGRRFHELLPLAAKDGRPRPYPKELQNHIGSVRLPASPPGRAYDVV